VPQPQPAEGGGIGPMPNERTTEDVVREHLKRTVEAGQRIEEQTSDTPKIKLALASASKSGPIA